jgi:DNA-binding response OmpR family regulator
MGNILVVDDSQTLVEVLSMLLQTKGYIVKGACSRKEIDKVLQVFKPDVILMDVRLEGENGRNICTEMKTNPATQNAAVILISATPENLQEYELCKADDVIQKPFDLNEVVCKIKRLSEKGYQYQS